MNQDDDNIINKAATGYCKAVIIYVAISFAKFFLQDLFGAV